MVEAFLLFGAGVLGGLLNAIAGGGTFITFPALVAAGVPLVMANATATIASLPGYLASAIGFRHDLARLERSDILRLTLWTALGGALGSGLLLISSNDIFSLLIPFLLGLATVVFIWAVPLREWAARHKGTVTPFGAGTMLPVALYGGYFNGGLGIVMLALFAMWGMRDLHAMNGLKSWLSFALSVISLAVFWGGGQIAWGPAFAMALGTIAGGFAGAPLSRRIPVAMLRALIAAIGTITTLIFAARAFGLS